MYREQKNFWSNVLDEAVSKVLRHVERSETPRQLALKIGTSHCVRCDVAYYFDF